jgi:hypothetical protein
MSGGRHPVQPGLVSYTKYGQRENASVGDYNDHVQLSCRLDTTWSLPDGMFMEPTRFYDGEIPQIEFRVFRRYDYSASVRRRELGRYRRLYVLGSRLVLPGCDPAPDCRRCHWREGEHWSIKGNCTAPLQGCKGYLQTEKGTSERDDP